jgi:hypothetical protein
MSAVNILIVSIRSKQQPCSFLLLRNRSGFGLLYLEGQYSWFFKIKFLSRQLVINSPFVFGAAN